MIPALFGPRPSLRTIFPPRFISSSSVAVYTSCIVPYPYSDGTFGSNGSIPGATTMAPTSSSRASDSASFSCSVTRKFPKKPSTSSTLVFASTSIFSSASMSRRYSSTRSPLFTIEGEIFSYFNAFPPRVFPLSTMYTLLLLPSNRAAEIPAIPPPITSTSGLVSISFCSRAV